MSSSTTSQQERYTLHYWPQIPGRGEFVRLCFELTKHQYIDSTDIPRFQALLLSSVPASGQPTHFAPPILEVASSESKEPFYISQTPAILNFLAPRLGLLGDAHALSGLDREVAQSQILQLCLVALDLNNEVHDTHHPIAVAKYYEEQKDEALKKAQDVRDSRIPKFFKFFQLNLMAQSAGSGGRLYGSKTTVADLVVFQVVDGLKFAFPTYMKGLEASSKFDAVFQLHADISKELSDYLGSSRRRPYSDGVFRYYPELDGPAPKNLA
ncbi:hypothetical protein BCV70DRAFT_196841 [Testicularia cyperi]|uniref:Glutathione S-transferase C-terminal domain-containing protein n=1 Tax=Testicularia cyperi TaxID=1882483 RepID=A0A317XXE3_9BASI|nr:hypothetical protein BCV70DRAFT_196841 [Testicularia cyperi]